MEAINLDLNIDLSEQEINFEVLNCHLDVWWTDNRWKESASAQQKKYPTKAAL